MVNAEKRRKNMCTCTWIPLQVPHGRLQAETSRIASSSTVAQRPDDAPRSDSDTCRAATRRRAAQRLNNSPRRSTVRSDNQTQLTHLISRLREVQRECESVK